MGLLVVQGNEGPEVSEPAEQMHWLWEITVGRFEMRPHELGRCCRVPQTVALGQALEEAGIQREIPNRHKLLKIERNAKALREDEMPVAGGHPALLPVAPVDQSS